MDCIETLLSFNEFVIIDGGLATELENEGANLNDNLWSAKLLIENPELIIHVHKSYLEAGAQIITSSSYQASFEGFEKKGFDREQACELLKRSIILAQEARSDFIQSRIASDSSLRNETDANLRTQQEVISIDPLVAASIGCYGAFLADGSEYNGSYGYQLGVDKLVEWHQPRLETLLEADPDVIAFETIPCLEEIQALVILLDQLAQKRSSLPPAWISVVCGSGDCLCSGQSLEDAVQLVEVLDVHNRITMLGVNCTAPQFVLEAVQTISSFTTRSIMAYPNSGETWDSNNHQWLCGTGTSDTDLAMLAVECFKAGARIFGGCCRTSPNTIKSIHGALEKYCHTQSTILNRVDTSEKTSGCKI